MLERARVSLGGALWSCGGRAVAKLPAKNKNCREFTLSGFPANFARTAHGGWSSPFSSPRALRRSIIVERPLHSPRSAVLTPSIFFFISSLLSFLLLAARIITISKALLSTQKSGHRGMRLYSRFCRWSADDYSRSLFQNGAPSSFETAASTNLLDFSRYAWRFACSLALPVTELPPSKVLRSESCPRT